MSGATDATASPGAIRETYEEFAVGDATVGMIADPENGNAWIQSTVVEQVVQ